MFQLTCLSLDQHFICVHTSHLKTDHYWCVALEDGQIIKLRLPLIHYFAPDNPLLKHVTSPRQFSLCVKILENDFSLKEYMSDLKVVDFHYCTLFMCKAWEFIKQLNCDNY